MNDANKEKNVLQENKLSAVKTHHGLLKKVIFILLLLIIVFAVVWGMILIKSVKKSNYYNSEQIKSLLVRINYLENKANETGVTAPNIAVNSSNYNIMTLVECMHLIQAANFILLTDGDSQKALQLLITAKSLVSRNQIWFELNNTLAKDIAALQNSAKVNTADRVLELENINKMLSVLPQINLANTYKTPVVSVQQKKELPSKASKVEPSNWHEIFMQIGTSSAQALKNLVIIRDNSQPISRLLSNEELNNVRIIMQVKIMQAEWALIHKQPTLYEYCLHDIESMLNKYYSQEVLMKTNILQLLHKVQNYDVLNKVVDISASISAANTALKVASIVDSTQAQKSVDNKPTLVNPGNVVPAKSEAELEVHA